MVMGHSFSPWLILTNFQTRWRAITLPSSQKLLGGPGESWVTVPCPSQKVKRHWKVKDPWANGLLFAHRFIKQRTSIHIHTWIFYIYIYIHTHVYVYIETYTHMYIYRAISICRYIHMYIHKTYDTHTADTIATTKPIYRYTHTNQFHVHFVHLKILSVEQGGSGPPTLHSSQMVGFWKSLHRTSSWPRPWRSSQVWWPERPVAGEVVRKKSAGGVLGKTTTLWVLGYYKLAILKA